MLFTSALDQQARDRALRGIVENIKTSVGAMEELFNALLDISRLDAGVLQPEPSHFSLNVLTERLANDFGPDAGAKGLELHITHCDIVVYSDATLLERILRNLVANAIRYTDEGEVRLQCRQQDGRVHIDVIDTGVGIPAQRQREIFNEFHQLGNPERDRTQGLGLGLAIVDRIARLLGHEINLESTPSQGSRFSVTVPAGEAGHVPADDAPWADSVLSDLVGLHALVVDDDVAVREGMRTLLEL